MCLAAILSILRVRRAARKQKALPDDDQLCLSARYLRGSEALMGEAEGVLLLEELLACLERTQEPIAAALERVGEAGLAREITLSGDRKRTLGQQVFFLYFHEVYHVGQTELLRQLAGKNDKII